MVRGEAKGTYGWWRDIFVAWSRLGSVGWFVVVFLFLDDRQESRTTCQLMRDLTLSVSRGFGGSFIKIQRTKFFVRKSLTSLDQALLVELFL